MTPYQLIGLPYRLGAIPDKHQAADCLSLARAVLAHYGIDSPAPTRNWYRRLRRGDYDIFPEQLECWGEKVEQPRIGAVALCKGEVSAYCLAAYFAEVPGWLSFAGREVRWSPIEALPIVSIYCPTSGKFAMQ